MTDHLTPDERALAERVAADATRTVSRFWLAEIAKLEEATTDPAARWDLLKQALRLIGRRTR